MRHVFIVGLGGFLGATGRYILSGYVQSVSNSIDFPYGTLVVNVLGCFLIGLLGQLADARGIFGPESRSLILIGIFGAVTTFSTFSIETLNLLTDGETVLAGLNVGTNFGLCLLAVWLGRVLVLVVWR